MDVGCLKIAGESGRLVLKNGMRKWALGVRKWHKKMGVGCSKMEQESGCRVFVNGTRKWA